MNSNLVKLEKEYNEMFEELSVITSTINVCKFDEKGLCIRERGNLEKKKSCDPYCCCGGMFFESQKNEKHCPHFIIGKGCSTKSISCKTWHCEAVHIPYEKEQKIRAIKFRAMEKGFYLPRGDFKDLVETKRFDKKV